MVLDESNFDETIKKYPMIVVDFYAPWCPHCKALAPEWSQAAHKLLEHQPPIPMAKVDATTQLNLKKRFVKIGFPTIISFTYSGTVQKEYTKAARDAESLIKWVEQQYTDFGLYDETAYPSSFAADAENSGVLPKSSAQPLTLNSILTNIFGKGLSTNPVIKALGSFVNVFVSVFKLPLTIM